MSSLIERLLARDRDFGRRADEQPALNNPDGPEAAALIQSLYTKIARKNAALGEVHDWIRFDLEAGTPKASAALRMVAEALAEDGGKA